jgi:hypothetical protein
MYRATAALVVALVMAMPAAADPQSNGQIDPANRPEQAADKSDRMICKRFTETGSLVSTYRSCKTKREWENVRDNRTSMNSIGNCMTPGACK